MLGRLDRNLRALTLVSQHATSLVDLTLQVLGLLLQPSGLQPRLFKLSLCNLQDETPSRRCCIQGEGECKNIIGVRGRQTCNLVRWYRTISTRSSECFAGVPNAASSAAWDQLQSCGCNN